MYKLLVVAMITAGAAAAQQQAQKPLERLEANILRITRSVNATWGIYLKCLETGEEIALNADQQMDTMSVIKIPLMVEAFRQIEEGKFALTDRITLTDAMKRPGTGIIRSLDAGAVLTYQGHAHADDYRERQHGDRRDVRQGRWDRRGESADDQLRFQIDQGNRYGGHMVQGDRCVAQSDQFHLEAKTPFGLSSPREMGKLLEKIEKGEAVSKKASEQMLQMMRGQVYSSRLPKYVTGFRVPHKTGDFLPYIGNDVGILESRGRNVVLSMFTARHFGVGAQLEDAIGRVAELVGNYFASRE
jgi:beta-lactamase class A